MPPLRPNSSREGYARASAFRRMFLYANVDAPNSWSQFRPVMNACSSSASMPLAKAPPTSPPMLVPAATSIGMRCSSIQRMTPTCAMPRALPPPKATPTTGRFVARTIWTGRSASRRRSASRHVGVAQRIPHTPAPGDRPPTGAPPPLAPSPAQSDRIPAVSATTLSPGACLSTRGRRPVRSVQHDAENSSRIAHRKWQI